MNQKTERNPTKFIKSRTLGDKRVEKEMKSFCASLKAFDHPTIVCREFWHKILYPSERDTKMYFRSLSRELFDFIGNIIGWIDKEYLFDQIDMYLKKFDSEESE